MNLVIFLISSNVQSSKFHLNQPSQFRNIITKIKTSKTEAKNETNLKFGW